MLSTTKLALLFTFLTVGALGTNANAEIRTIHRHQQSLSPNKFSDNPAVAQTDMTRLRTDEVARRKDMRTRNQGNMEVDNLWYRDTDEEHQVETRSSVAYAQMRADRAAALQDHRSLSHARASGNSKAVQAAKKNYRSDRNALKHDLHATKKPRDLGLDMDLEARAFSRTIIRQDRQALNQDRIAVAHDRASRNFKAMKATSSTSDLTGPG
ncbi:hypothetical protein CALVIDRAFT_532674 [Calocera viscosa TUFC12733]|uniref:Uncharacterized protein n=1 Tax=Calocera viscosa (strain TUFC12733) TaxID=1330018 RepID=A0A167RM55_CALVF|nr:hypothetical protein CALVIDRAFT_532674 [Calocera viscosa TUFC12733]